MEFTKVVKNRTATRKFSDKVVDNDILEKILEVGRLSPTAKNLQPEVIYVVKSKEGLSKIDASTPCRYNAPIVLLICSDKNIAFSNNGDSTYEIDASIVATHLLLASTNYGVDNIWIKYFDKDIIKKEFNLEENIIPICLIPLGYKDKDCPININHNKRKDLNEIVKYV